MSSEVTTAAGLARSPLQPTASALQLLAALDGAEGERAASPPWSSRTPPPPSRPAGTPQRWAASSAQWTQVSPQPMLATQEAPWRCEEADVEAVFSGELRLATYDWNDLLIKSSPPHGHRFEPSSFAADPLFLQVEGRPALEHLVAPEHRLWCYGAAGSAWTSFHLGEGLAAAADRSPLATEAFYEVSGESLRRVRILRLRPAPRPPNPWQQRERWDGLQRV